MTAPGLSVIVTTYNRRELVRACLASLDGQLASGLFEVIVVVDGSTDGTEEMLAHLDPPYPLTVLAQPQSGQTAARNAGAERARGRVLLFLDDDEEAAPALVSSHLSAHGDENVVGVGVIRRRVPEHADRLAKLRAEESELYYKGLAGRPLTYDDCFGGNSSVSRPMFAKVGGYAADVSSENDFEFAYRLDQAGAVFVFLPDAVVTEYRTRRWRGILTDGEVRGRTAVELYERHPGVLPMLPLGGFGHWPRSWRATRAALLAVHFPSTGLGLIGLVLPARWSRDWFRLVWNYSYWRGARRAMNPDLRRRSKRGTPILRYHAFGADGEPASRYAVPQRRFERQMSWLHRRGYSVISLDEYVAHRREHRFPPAKSVVLTFDDGYVDNFTVARPTLERFDFQATVFVITDAAGKNRGAADPELVDRRVADLEQAASMRGDQIVLAPHSRTHPDLTMLDPEVARTEVEGSRSDVEHVVGTPPLAFAYPFGESNPEVRQIARNAGFEVACGVKPGHNWPATDSFDLRRIEVRGTDSLFRFAAMLVVGELRRG
jgi:peptidoglycan/xylan/chitin deacetylase (PgdA/CDA1 family)/glycosyltransferase involved in cell wall biosynthesis